MILYQTVLQYSDILCHILYTIYHIPFVVVINAFVPGSILYFYHTLTAYNFPEYTVLDSVILGYICIYHVMLCFMIIFYNIPCIVYHILYSRCMCIYIYAYCNILSYHIMLCCIMLRSTILHYTVLLSTITMSYISWYFKPSRRGSTRCHARSRPDFSGPCLGNPRNS